MLMAMPSSANENGFLRGLISEEEAGAAGWKERSASQYKNRQVMADLSRVIDTPDGQVTISFMPKERKEQAFNQDSQPFGHGYLSVVVSFGPSAYMEITFVSQGRYFPSIANDTVCRQMWDDFQADAAVPDRTQCRLCHPPKFLDKVRRIFRICAKERRDEVWDVVQSRNRGRLSMWHMQRCEMNLVNFRGCWNMLRGHSSPSVNWRDFQIWNRYFAVRKWETWVTAEIFLGLWAWVKTWVLIEISLKESQAVWGGPRRAGQGNWPFAMKRVVSMPTSSFWSRPISGWQRDFTTYRNGLWVRELLIFAWKVIE